MQELNLETQLRRLASDLIAEITHSSHSIREGTVMTMGPAPYRRLDCDGRALAYIRTRPRKGLVRVDVSGLWIAPNACSIRIPNAGGSATLVIRSEEDRSEAITYLKTTVERTRAAYAEERARKNAAALMKTNPISATSRYPSRGPSAVQPHASPRSRTLDISPDTRSPGRTPVRTPGDDPAATPPSPSPVPSPASDPPPVFPAVPPSVCTRARLDEHA